VGKCARAQANSVAERSARSLLDYGAFGCVFVTAEAFEADDAVLLVNFVEVGGRVTSGFAFVDAP